MSKYAMGSVLEHLTLDWFLNRLLPVRGVGTFAKSQINTLPSTYVPVMKRGFTLPGKYSVLSRTTSARQLHWRGRTHATH